MPSLPSLPGFDDSAELPTMEETSTEEDNSFNPLHSTPAAFSNHTAASTIRPPSSTTSTVRFAHSIASRSTKSSASVSRGFSASARSSAPAENSFDISAIPSVPNVRGSAYDIQPSDQDTDDADDYLPPAGEPVIVDDDDELDISDALQSMSRSGSPVPDGQPTPKKVYDYSVSLRSEPKASPFDKLRNISFRRPPSRTLARTPSLTRTTPSPNSSTSHSTPGTTRSYPNSQNASPLPALNIPLPRSATASPTTAFSPRTVRQEVRFADVSGDRSVQEHPSQSEQDMSIESNLHTEQEHTNQGQDEREPTFSSEEGMRSSTRDTSSNVTGYDNHMPSPAEIASAFSSPAPSALFTPTPAFQPRPRARFNLQPQVSTTPQENPGDESNQDETTWRADPQQHGSNETHQEDFREDPATPHAHKRSFLLSVINSTARPRPKFLPTPHPYRVQNNVNTEEADQTAMPMTPGVNLHSAFAGVTPRPRGPVRRRLSHPLTQTFAPHPTPAQSTQSGDTGSRSESPYEERVSFISTTSSQDLTTHARANASFDPVIGLGERGHGLGRFNAGKLNSYLHGLNRKLQEENEGLVARLREYEETYGNIQDKGSGSQAGTTPSPTSTYNSSRSRRTSGGRRVSVGPGLNLGDVAEVAEGMAEEKAALEDMVDDLKESLEKCTAEKEEAEKALESERNERARDKERWRDRMGEVEKGVENIVRELENKQHEAEEKARLAEEDKVRTVREVERRLAEVVVERDILQERIEQAEGALESGRDLGAELNAANERVGKAMGELKNAEIEIKELEDEVKRKGDRVITLENDLKDERQHNSDLQEELDITVDKFSQAVRRVEDLDKELKTTQQELAASKDYITQLEQDAGTAAERIQDFEHQIASTHAELEEAQRELEEEFQAVDHLEEENKKSAELARQMEEALEAAEQRMIEDEEQLAAFKDKVAALERELDKSRSYHEPSQIGPVSELQAQIEDLENELTEAHKEVARLKTALSQSPARKAIEKAKDAKIEMLEKEKEDLQERLKMLKTQSQGFNTPSRVVNNSGISPMHRHILSMKSPKTPGGPLRDMSWLHSTMNDATAAPLIAEIERLQQELERANEDIDDKLDRLEDAGVGVVSLTQQLEDAKTKVSMLEVEIALVSRREERRIKRLQRVRCQKCRTKVDLSAIIEINVGDDSSYLDTSTISMATEPPTPPTKTSEKLRGDLQAVNTQLNSMKQQWEGERQKLLGENAVLQDATKRLNAEVRNAKTQIERYANKEREGERNRGDIEQELANAKGMVEELEEELKEERSRLRALTAEQTQAERQREKITLQLRRTESDMSEIKEHLHKIKQENHELEAELRSNANIDQKARLLEQKVAENAATIEQLRQERSLLVADHKNLQKRYTEASKHVNKLRDNCVAGQTSHDNRRHQLDLQVLEIEDLRRALSQRDDELQRVEEEKKQMASEKDDVARTVAALEADLRRVKRDAEAFGRDLKSLRAQKDKLEAERKEAIGKAERAQKQAQSQIRLLKEELMSQKEKARAGEERWRSHVCAADEQQLQSVKIQHKNECKGLVVQIRYLKAKFTRESTLRCDLGYQKRYLLALLGRSERTEQKILAAIARIGFLTIDPPKHQVPKRTFKTVVLSVIFIRRAERASEAWRQQTASKEAIAAALQEVRRRRITSPADEAPVVATSSRKGKERAPS